MMALQMGVARSVFSNEAGLGISSIAAAAAITDSPGRQAMITMTGAFLYRDSVHHHRSCDLSDRGDVGRGRGRASFSGAAW